MNSSSAAIRVVFFDIDGTLYRKETGTLPDSVHQAIRALKKRHIIPAIATGRTIAALPLEIRHLIDQEQIELFVTINGQYNVHQRRVLSHHPMATSDLSDIITKLTIAHIDYALINERVMSVSADTPVVQEALKTIGSYSINPYLHLEQDIYQMLIFCREDKEQYIREHIVPDNYQILRWHSEGIDILPKEGSKVRGIQEVCRTLNIPMAATMAFGDGLNDIEMLEGVGIGIAMGDAHKAVLARVNDHTDTLENDGILKALQRYGLAD